MMSFDWYVTGRRGCSLPVHQWVAGATGGWIPELILALLSFTSVFPSVCIHLHLGEPGNVLLYWEGFILLPSCSN